MLTCLYILMMIIIIEALLSADNAVVIGTIANKANPQDRNKVVKYGIVGAFLFRGLLLFTVGWFMNNPQIGGLAKLFGGIYLLYLAKGLLTPKEDIIEEGETPSWIKWVCSVVGLTGLWLVIFEIELVDLTFSIDNLFAAVAFTENVKGEVFGMPLNIVLTIIGVSLGIVMMRFVTMFIMKLMRQYPALEHSAAYVILILGFKLILSAIFTLLEPVSLEFFANQIERFAYFMETIKPYIENHIVDLLFSITTLSIFAYPIIKQKISK